MLNGEEARARAQGLREQAAMKRQNAQQFNALIKQAEEAEAEAEKWDAIAAFLDEREANANA